MESFEWSCLQGSYKDALPELVSDEDRKAGLLLISTLLYAC